MSEKNDLSRFEENIREAICDKKVSRLCNCDRLEEYLQLLNITGIITLYRNCAEEAPRVHRNLLAGSGIPEIIAKELIRRYLVGIPRNEYLQAMGLFLQHHYPHDPLLGYMDELYNCIQNNKNWFEQEQAYLSILAEISSTDTPFRSTINKVLLTFQPQDIYSANIIVTVKKDDNGSNFRKEHMVDGLIRRVCTYGTWTDAQVFPPNALAGGDFDMVARRAQEYLRARGKVSKNTQIMCYDFIDGLAHCSELQHKGISAGLAFARIAYSHHNLLDNRLEPYIAWCGSLGSGNTIEPVSDINTKARIARENGIRVIVLPDANKTEIEEPDRKENEIQLIGYPEGKLGEVLDFTQKEVGKLHTIFLGPKELEHWDKLIEKSKQEVIPLLNRAKQGAKYDPGKYVNRDNIESDFQFFLKDTSTNCMAIIGDSGFGKTSLLCHLCEDSIGKNIVLFYDGQHLRNDNINILDLKPDELGTDMAAVDLIRMLNRCARRMDGYLILFLDAINAAETEDNRDRPLRILEDIESLVVDLTKIRSDRVKIVLSCRTKVWGKLLNSGIGLSEQRYYGGSKGMSLNRYTDQELEKALEKYFGNLAHNLTHESRQVLRNPFMMALAAEVYSSSGLPSNLLSWDLIDGYYEKYIPISDNRRQLMNLLVEQMLLQKTYAILRHSSGNQELDRLLSSDSFDRLIDDGVLEQEGDYVSFPHERFAEMHLARNLMRQSGGALTQNFVLGHLKNAQQFYLLWGALRLILINEWDVVKQLAQTGDRIARDMVVDCLTALAKDEGRLDVVCDTISHLMDLNGKSKGVQNSKRVAIQVATELLGKAPNLVKRNSNEAKSLENILEKAVYDKSGKVRNTAYEYIYYLSMDNSGAALNIVESLSQNIKITWRIPKLIKSAMGNTAISVLMYCDAFHASMAEQAVAQEIIAHLHRTWAEAIRRCKHLLIIVLWTVRTFSRVVLRGEVGYIDPFNHYELSHFFRKLNQAEKDVLVELAPYLTLGRRDISSAADIIAQVAGRSDMLTFYQLILTFTAQSSIGNTDDVFEIIERIYQNGSDFSKSLCSWALDSIMRINNSGIDKYRELIEKHLDNTDNWWTKSNVTNIEYCSYALYELINHHEKIQRSIAPQITSKYIEMARGNAKLMLYIIENMRGLAIYCGYPSIAIDVLKRIIDDEAFAQEMLLFSLKPIYQRELKKCNISDGLRQEFKKRGYSLSQNAIVLSVSSGYLVTDEDSKQIYCIEKTKRKLNVYSQITKRYIETMMDIKLHYPKAIEDLLQSIGNGLSSGSKRMIMNAESSELLGHLFGMKMVSMVPHLLAENPELRSEFATAIAVASKCRNLGAWSDQFLRRTANRIAGKEILKAISIDEKL